MSIRNLEHLFKPASVALIGASNQPHGVGTTVLKNLVDGGFAGNIWPVNPKYDALMGMKCYAKVSALPAAPELAILCTPPATIPGLIAELGARGTKAAIVLTAGLGALKVSGGKTAKQAMLDAARPYLLRILGPNCVGLLVPGIGLNASFAHTGALAGKIAFISQSGALVTGVLDWANARGIGFSKFISLGEAADADFGDLLDYLASDADTGAILLYMEDLHHARKFMSAARIAARSKPVIVLKAGRAAEGAKAAASHTGALAGSDAVYDAALRRAGMLRVYSTEDLFNAVETLARAKPQFAASGERLTIMTNGGGLGVTATDALIAGGGQLHELSPESLAQLDKLLPGTWSHANPVDIIGDAPVERYVSTLEVLLKEPQSDALLFLHAPSAIVAATEIAVAVVPLAAAARNNILSCWLGGATVAPARQVFAEAGLPTYDTPEKAVQGFLQIIQYRRNQELLMQVPAHTPVAAAPARAAARAIVTSALADGQTMLSEPQAKALLAAYGIPVIETRIATDTEQALVMAGEIGYPVVLKLLSPQISHKSDVGGVALDLDTPEALRSAANAMRRRVGALRPDATLAGFSVQQMALRPQAQELIVGVSTDPVFGPVILFGQGGVAVEVMNDHAIGLPPLNSVLANDMIGRTRVSKLLAGYRNRPRADHDAICQVLIQVSQMVADLPELAELDINPLLADADGVIALDARIRLEPGASADRLAIRPYPQELEQRVEWQGETIVLRPIRPEDAAQHLAFFHALTPEDVRLRTFSAMRELQPAQLARLTQIDYDRAMAFIAIRESAPGISETLGVARAVACPDNLEAEFAIIVRSDLKGTGLGSVLFKKLVDYFRSRGTQALVGEALAHNAGVQDLVRKFGGSVAASSDTVQLRIELQQPAP